MLASGSFSVLSSVVGSTIWVLIYAYDQSPNRTCLQSVGFSMVIGLAATVTFGAPAEWIGLLERPPSEECAKGTIACVPTAASIYHSIEATLFAIWFGCSLLAFVLDGDPSRGHHSDSPD